MALPTIDFSRFDQRAVDHLAVAIEGLSLEAPPAQLIHGLAEYSTLPVIEPVSNRLVGLMRDQTLLNSPERFSRGDYPPFENTLALVESATVGEVRGIFQRFPDPLIPFVDSQHRYTGLCASRKKLLEWLEGSFKPPRIGGLSTPLGVYMTSGVYTSGPGLAGLVTLGACFAILSKILEWGFLIFSSLLLAWFPGLEVVNPAGWTGIQFGFMLLGILLTVKLTPLAGLHAAEHMTISAIEKGLEITEPNVQKQPRQHVRCGTNLMVLLLGIQLGWISLDAMRPFLSPTGAFLYLVGWIFFLSRFWRPMGIWLQTHFTTKDPTRKQLENAMASGQELLVKYLAQPHSEPSFGRRVWGSGILQMIASFSLVTWLLNQGIQWVISSLLVYSLAW